MRTAQHQRVDVGALQRFEVTLGQPEDLSAAGDAALDEVDESRAGHRGDLGVAGGGEGVLVGARGDGGLGSDHADAAVAGGGDGPAHRGQDHLDDGHVVALARIVQAGRRCRVAGDHQRLDAAVDQIVADRQGMRADLGNGERPVGTVAGVADVDDVLVGQLVDDGARHRQPADAGVEHPDRRQCVTHVRHSPPRFALVAVAAHVVDRCRRRCRASRSGLDSR